MTRRIRPFEAEDVEAVVRLSLAAWEPVFVSFREVLGERIYRAIYPDWRVSQAKAVEGVCVEEAMTVWVAEEDGVVVGFIAYKVDGAGKEGETEMLAVDPAYQNRGIGTELSLFVLEQMRERGVELAVVGTGGDPGHAPARRSYEKAGYTGLPIVRYYKALGEG